MDRDGLLWRRGRMLGRGSYGSVFLATSKSWLSCFPQVMAVKSAEFCSSASLQKEKETLCNLGDSPYIVKCYGEETTVGYRGEIVYNVLLEYASGGTLGDVIEKAKGCGLPECDVRCYTKSILRGLCHVHDSGYVHCDLKPDNVLLMKVGKDEFVAKIADFGLAKRGRLGKKQRFDPSMRGTPMYLAPETVVYQVQEPPSDIWALGCVVLEMLTGKDAWDVKEDTDLAQLLCMIGDEHSCPEIPSGISNEAREFLMGCFVRKPMHRFTAEMLLDTAFVQGPLEAFIELEDNSGAEVLLDTTNVHGPLEDYIELKDLPDGEASEGPILNCAFNEVADSRIQMGSEITVEDDSGAKEVLDTTNVQGPLEDYIELKDFSDGEVSEGSMFNCGFNEVADSRIQITSIGSEIIVEDDSGAKEVLDTTNVQGPLEDYIELKDFSDGEVSESILNCGFNEVSDSRIQITCIGSEITVEDLYLLEALSRPAIPCTSQLSRVLCLASLQVHEFDHYFQEKKCT